MEKLKKVNMILLDKEAIKVDEVLDIGQYYYLLDSKNIRAIKKVNIAWISWESKKQENDSSKYVKD